MEVTGLIVAILIKSERLVPLIVGAGQAAVAAVIAFGLPVSPDQSGAIMAFLHLAAGVIIRDRVEAKVAGSMSCDLTSSKV